MPVLVFTIGATNVGKSTLLNYAKSISSSEGTCPYGFVEVGKMMRAKYPPDFFSGSGAPVHTQKEAWKMFLDGVAVERDAGKEIIFIDGQPRNMEQYKWACALSYSFCFAHLFASYEVRKNRAMDRDCDDPKKLELSLKRLDSDIAPLYDIVSAIHYSGDHPIISYNTEKDAPAEMLMSITRMANETL